MILTAENIDWTTLRTGVCYTTAGSGYRLTSTTFTSNIGLTCTVKTPGIYFVSGGISFMTGSANEIHDIFMAIFNGSSQVSGTLRSLYGGVDGQTTGRFALQTSGIVNVTSANTLVSIRARVNRSFSTVEEGSIQIIRIG